MPIAVQVGMKTNIALVAVVCVLAGCAADAEPSSREHADEAVAPVPVPTPAPANSELSGIAPAEQELAAMWKADEAPSCVGAEEVRCACGPCAVMSACVSLCEGPPR